MARRDDDDDFEPRPRRTVPALSTLDTYLAIGRAVAWGVCAVAVVLVLVVYLLALKKAENGIQEASLSASAAALMIGPYALARCVDGATRYRS